MARFLAIPNVPPPPLAEDAKFLRHCEMFPWKVVDTERNWDHKSTHRTKAAAEQAAARYARLVEGGK